MVLSEKDRLTLLSHPIFEAMQAEELFDAMDRFGVRISEFSEGDLLSACGERHLGVILHGRAAVKTPEEARTVLLRFLESGDAFGLSELFSREAPVSRIMATGPVRCLLFPEQCITHLLDTSAAFRRNYLAFLAGRIRFLNRKITYLTAGSAERRLALYLSSLGEGEVRLRDSITSLSDLLNLGRASLYRAFDRLEADGFLVKNGRTLILTDVDAMLKAY